MAKAWDFSAENEKAAKKKAKGLQDKAAGGGGGKIGNEDRMKLSGGLNRVLICQPWNDKGDIVKPTMVHQVWKNKRPIATAACPRIVEGDDCKVCARGWELKDKYKDSKNQKKQNAWRLFMATQDHYANVINLQGDDRSVKILKLPQKAYATLLDEVNSDDVSLKDICHLDNGRPMRIKGNGKEGNFRRYEIAKFEKNPANLIANGEVDKEEVLNALFDLDKLQPKPNEKKLEEVFLKIKKQATSILGAEAEEEDEDEDVDADEDEDADEDSDSDDEDSDDEDADGEDDDDDDMEDDDEEEEDEDDSDDEDEEDDSEDDEDSDDDDSDEDDEDDSDDEDEDDEEEEEPAPKKKKKPLPEKKSLPAKKPIKKKK